MTSPQTKEAILAEDQAARRAVLDPNQSFILQAGAGSGKTELLVQRYISLLAYRAEQPEEIIAITFTRKAASEMRQRVLDTLQLDTSQPLPDHRLHLKKLVDDVRTKDTTLNWQLTANPQRLRIMTIDALSTQLLQRMPLLAKLGANLQPSEEGELLYQSATKQLIEQLWKKPEGKKQLQTLLPHLNNNIAQLEQLLQQLLAKRDQWLPYLFSLRAHEPEQLKILLEQSLQQVRLEAMQQAQTHCPRELQSELFLLGRFAAEQLNRLNIDSPVSELANIDCLPEATLDDYPCWRAFAALVLTKQETLRRSIDRRHGFPAAADAENKEQKSLFKENKAAMKELLTSLSEQTALIQALQAIQLAPPITYEPNQWQVIQCLLELLPLLVAELHLVFKAEGQVDFTQLTLSALQALNDEDGPSQLAMQLDYQIKHLLIDEYQDTSITQYHLIEKLIEHWDEQDHRTLFLVGDPMQSIYRFRQAEVGLFLRSAEHGVGRKKLIALKLHCNFRSNGCLVDWFNQLFPHVFPAQQDISLGAVNYTASVSQQANDNGAVQFYSHHSDAEEENATHILALIEQLLKKEGDIALLVRSRNHLAAILPLLEASGIAYEAQGLSPIAHYPVVRDLLNLTLALMHWGDRLAWLALLRAPVCGLSLADLLTIAQFQPDTTTLWPLLQNSALISTLSDDGQARLQQLTAHLTQAFSVQHQYDFSFWVKSVWHAIDGPDYFEHEQDQQLSQRFFELLQTNCQNDNLPEREQLITQCHKQLYSENTEAARVKVMTIHKAKGLEFDHVIIPALEKSAASDQAALLLWLQRPRQTTGDDLLIAPIRAAEQKADPIYQYVNRIERQKQQLELARLFYVAVTRAKQSLHLIANIDENSDRKPLETSFLHFIKKAGSCDPLTEKA